MAKAAGIGAAILRRARPRAAAALAEHIAFDIAISMRRGGDRERTARVQSSKT